MEEFLIKQASELGEVKGIAKMTNDNVILLSAKVDKYFEKTDSNTLKIAALNRDRKWLIGIMGMVSVIATFLKDIWLHFK